MLLLWQRNLKVASSPLPKLGDGEMAIWWSLLTCSAKMINSGEVTSRVRSGLGGTCKSASNGTCSWGQDQPDALARTKDPGSTHKQHGSGNVRLTFGTKDGNEVTGRLSVREADARVGL